MLRFIVNTGGGSLNPNKPTTSSWLIQAWLEDPKDMIRIRFALVRKTNWNGRPQGRPVAIGSWGGEGGAPGEAVILIDSQTTYEFARGVLLGWYIFPQLVSELKYMRTSATVYSLD